jgi:hypothetical protein
MSLSKSEYDRIQTSLHSKKHKLSKNLSTKYNHFLVNFYSSLETSAQFFTRGQDLSINLEHTRKFLDKIKTLEDDLKKLENDTKSICYGSIIIPSFLSGCSIFAPGLNLKLFFVGFTGISALLAYHNIETIVIETEIQRTSRYLLSRIKGYLELQLQNFAEYKDDQNYGALISTNTELHTFCTSIRKVSIGLCYEQQ